MSKFLLTDIDGCVLNWHRGFIDFAGKLGFDLAANPQTSYDMSEWFEEMSTEQFVGLVDLFNNSEFSLLCPPYADVLTYLPKIAKRHRVEALTAFGDRPAQAELRRKLINAMFPDAFDEIHVIGLRQSKHEYLERLKPDLFVEDSVSHADNAKELGIQTVIIPHSYNGGTEHQYTSEANPWKSIKELLEKPELSVL